MAGDWMKIELELPDKPEVHYIAGALNMSSAEVVGHLIKVWGWFDKHTTDGNAYGVTSALLDKLTSVTGFGEAMCLAGWLEQHDKTLHMPNFDRHTSESAKKRALTGKRVKRSRNANSVTEALPEKRRKENINKDTPVIPKARKRSLPTDFKISKNVQAWAAEKGIQNLPAHYEYFIDCAKAKGYQYVDWDSAFMNAIKGDWAKVGFKAERGVQI